MKKKRENHLHAMYIAIMINDEGKAHTDKLMHAPFPKALMDCLTVNYILCHMFTALW